MGFILTAHITTIFSTSFHIQNGIVVMVTLRTYAEAATLLESTLARIDRVSRINEHMLGIAVCHRQEPRTPTQTAQAQAEIDASLAKIHAISESEDAYSELLKGKGEIQSTLSSVSRVQASYFYRASLADRGDQSVAVEISEFARRAELLVPNSAFASSNNNTSSVLEQRVIFELASHRGAELFTFEAQTSLQQVHATLNLFTDVTGVEAHIGEAALKLKTLDCGSDAWIEIQVIDEPNPQTFSRALTQRRTFGADAEVSINGVPAYSLGNQVVVSTEELAFAMTLAPNFCGNFQFKISGGGVHIDIDSIQVRLGIIPLTPLRLGSPSGRLFEIGAGQSKSLASHPDVACLILQDTLEFLVDFRNRIADFHANLASVRRRPFALQERRQQIRPVGRRGPASIPDAKLPHGKSNPAQKLVLAGPSVLHVDGVSEEDIEVFLRR